MNKDLLEMYVSSKHEGPGFMKRLKATWDAKYPHLQHFNDKQLRQQASQYGKRLQADAYPAVSIRPTERRMRGNIGEGSAPVRNNNTSEQDLQSELRTTFTSNILRFANMNLQERPFETKVNCQIPSETIEAINLLIESLVS